MGTEGSAVAIAIDAAVVADHHVMVRQRDAHGSGAVLEEFRVAPTLAGMGWCRPDSRPLVSCHGGGNTLGDSLRALVNPPAGYRGT